MNRNIFMFLSVALILLVPVPGRLAYGLVMLIEFVFLMCIGTLTKRLLVKIRIDEFKTAVIPLFMMAASIFYRQMLILISPMMAFTLGYAIYLPAVSAFLLGTLSEREDASLPSEMKRNLTTTVSISLPILIVFLIRDLIGYGTITLPGSLGPVVFHIIPKFEGFTSVTVFFASIPGALVSLGACTFIINRFGLRWESRRSPESKAERNASKADEKKSDAVQPVASEPVRNTDAGLGKPESERQEKPEKPELRDEPQTAPVQERSEEIPASAAQDSVQEEKPVLRNPFEALPQDGSVQSENGSGISSGNFTTSDAPSLLNLQKLLEETDVD